MLISLVLSAFPAFGAEPVYVTACAEVAGEVCAFFAGRNTERFIDTGRGTFVTNPLFRSSGPNAKQPAQMSTSFGSEAVLSELMDILDVPTIPALRTKLTLGLLAKTIFDQASERVTVPWPLDSNLPKSTEVDREVLMMSMRSQLGAKRLDRLRTFVNETRNRIEIEKQARAMATLDEGQRLSRERAAVIQADPKRVEVRRAEVEALFRSARADVLRVATDGLPREKWSAEQINMAKRIETFEPKFLTAAEGEAHPLCRNFNANAFNTAGTHRMNICPAATWLPDVHLYELFGHETAHNIDLCIMTNDFAEIDRPKLKLAAENPKFAEATRARLREFAALDADHVDNLFDLFLDDPRVKQMLIQAGAYKVVAPALEQRPKLWKDVAGCVAARYRYRQPTAERREQAIAQFRQNIDDFSGLDAAGRAAAETRLRRYLERKPDCSPSGSRQRTQMNEAVADVMGAVLREKWLHDHPPRGELEKMTSYLAGAMTCRDRDLEMAGGDLSPGSTVGTLAAIGKRIDDEHPASFKRLLMETDLPASAAAAGCVRADDACFDHLSLVNRAGAGAGGASTAR